VLDQFLDDKRPVISFYEGSSSRRGWHDLSGHAASQPPMSETLVLFTCRFRICAKGITSFYNSNENNYFAKNYYNNNQKIKQNNYVNQIKEARDVK